MVLVGASNLAQGLDLAFDEACARVGPATRVFAACGRGRSYGTRSSFLARGLPSVLECGLLRALDRRPSAALLADVGNDLAYGVEASRVLAWVRETAEQLDAERLVIAGLPHATLARLSPTWMKLWGRLIFPTRALDPAKIAAEVAELERGLTELAREFGAVKVELEPRWYGLDPIHFARRARREAWSTLLGSFGPRATERVDRRRLAGLAPAERTWFGVVRRRAQPCWRSSDGDELALY